MSIYKTTGSQFRWDHLDYPVHDKVSSEESKNAALWLVRGAKERGWSGQETGEILDMLGVLDALSPEQLDKLGYKKDEVSS